MSNQHVDLENVYEAVAAAEALETAPTLAERQTATRRYFDAYQQWVKTSVGKPLSDLWL